jgi:hypothetical protein
MLSPLETIELAIKELDTLRKLLRKKKQKQVRSSDERLSAKATAQTWFKSHKPSIDGTQRNAALVEIDDLYMNLLSLSDRDAARQTYLNTLKELKGKLISHRPACLLAASQGAQTYAPPDFSALVPDIVMQHILAARWLECNNCLQAQAPLAASVMIGGLLEGLLLARINKQIDKAPVFTAKSAPRDKHQKPKPLNQWGLKDYIAVAHELGWITVSAKDFGEILRDYRNFIHPHKQLTENVHLTSEDAVLFWEIARAIRRQIIAQIP